MGPSKVQKSAAKALPRAKPNENTRQLKRKRVVEDIEALNHRIHELKDCPVEKFSDLPLSAATIQGLENNHYKTTTDVQARAIVLGLKGRDILGAAKTGSGKTLAFLVPVLENLYRQKWNDTDGLGALILAPTRELAIQIFGILKKIGRKHAFSAGLVTGGKSFQEEREVLARMNIVIGTPGRVLHHLDQTASLNLDNLQMLVLDEADRIMDMGFKKDVDAIVEHLPPTRQTMLFSATQTKKLDDLRRLSVQDPEYISVHEQAQTATPATLKQYYISCPLPEKLNTLWGFIRENTKSKTIVFLSSAKQVRFVYETFRHMQPGISLLHLHGRQKQTARLDITKRFSSMQHACLFATDVAARGLDIPAVDWVLQLDCPEDVDTYIHRVGRTARYERDGQAVLFLEPTEEEGMLKRLEQKKIPVKLIKVKEKKQENIKHKLQDMCFKDLEIKYLGQKAFISYARSVYIHPDKEVFQIDKLDLQEFATSLGLPGAPKIKFQKGIDMKAIKNRSRAEALLSDDKNEGADGKGEAVRTKYDRMFERQNQDVLASHRQRLVQKDGRFGTDLMDENTSDDFLTVKRRLDDVEISVDDDAVEGENSHTNSDKKIHVKDGPDLPVDSKRREKLLTSKKALLKYGGKGHKTIFDDDGIAHEAYELEDEQAFRKRGEASEQRQQFVEKEAARVKAEDIADKELVKQKRRDKREKRKARELAAGQDEDEDGDLGSHLPVVAMEYLGDDSEDEEAAEKVKKPKKWFQTDASDEEEDDTRPRKKKRKTKGELEAALEGAETLEDLEALAQSL